MRPFSSIDLDQITNNLALVAVRSAFEPASETGARLFLFALIRISFATVAE